MTSALRWAVMRAILMFHNCEGQSHTTVSTEHNIWRERRAKADLNWSPSAYQPDALPLYHTGSQVFLTSPVDFILPRATGQVYFYTPGQEEAVFLSDSVSVKETGGMKWLVQCAKCKLRRHGSELVGFLSTCPPHRVTSGWRRPESEGLVFYSLWINGVGVHFSHSRHQVRWRWRGVGGRLGDARGGRQRGVAGVVWWWERRGCAQRGSGRVSGSCCRF